MIDSERRPLLQPSATSLKTLPNYGQTEATQSVSILAPQTEGPMWSVPVRRFASLWWQEFSLPDGIRYFRWCARSLLPRLQHGT